MMELTKAKLIEIIDAANEVITALADENPDLCKGNNDGMIRAWDYLNDDAAPPEVVRELARQLLAGLEQEPVAYFYEDGPKNWYQIMDGDSVPPNMRRPLYAAPQLPQPAMVPTFDEWCAATDNKPLGWVKDAMREAYDGCHAAMLLGAEPVKGWIPCSERMPEFDTSVLLYFPDYGGHIESGCIGDEGDGPYHYFFDGDSLRHEPTHWIPLPAAPQQEADNG